MGRMRYIPAQAAPDPARTDDAAMTLTPAERVALLDLARRSIAAALERGGALAPTPSEHWSDALAEHRSSFVTLRMSGELRGCCGTLEASKPLGEDVWRNACASAFGDPRFPALTAREWRDCDVHISVLTAPAPFEVQDENELIAQLRPGVDGLVLERGYQRATFLPAVWSQIEDAQQFVRALKHKAGWSPDFWSPDIAVSRYQCEDIGEH